jgi:hypothetical protein
MSKDKVKAVRVLAGLLFTAIGSTQAQARASASFIENITSVLAAQSLCGFTVNKDVLLTVMSNEGISPTDLQVGGMYNKEVDSNTARIVSLSSTEEGKRSFCRSIKSNLSSMFN